MEAKLTNADSPCPESLERTITDSGDAPTLLLAVM